MLLYAMIGLILIAFGLSLHVFKMYFLIKSYRKMSVERKANVDIEGMARFIGIVSYFDGALLLLVALLSALSIYISTFAIVVIIGISIIFMLIFSLRYDGYYFDENGKLKKGALKSMILPVTSGGIIIVVVAIVLLWTMQPLGVIVGDEALQIKGMYGGTYAYDQMKQLTYMNEIPKITMRTNGSALGSHLKGHFNVEELGSVTLFVDTNEHGFIYFEYDGKKIIFNQPVEELKSTYEELSSKVAP
ncbi:DUF3784 domain-containing protein [Fusibacter bizertensis]